jgi:hypothetical protein
MTPASWDQNSCAKVVLPAPLGPAMTMQSGDERARLLMISGHCIWGPQMTQAAVSARTGVRELVFKLRTPGYSLALEDQPRQVEVATSRIGAIFKADARSNGSTGSP